MCVVCENVLWWCGVWFSIMYYGSVVCGVWCAIMYYDGVLSSVWCAVVYYGGAYVSCCVVCVGQ